MMSRTSIVRPVLLGSLIMLSTGCVQPISLSVYRGDVKFGKTGRSADGLVLDRGETRMLTAAGRDRFGKPVTVNPTWQATAAGVVILTPVKVGKINVTGRKAGVTDLIVSSEGVQVVIHLRVR